MSHQLALFAGPTDDVGADEIAIYVAALVPVAIALWHRPVDEYTKMIARDGLSHFRTLIRNWEADDSKTVAVWRGWVAYFERMQAEGYEAAQPLRPQTWMGWGAFAVVETDFINGDAEANCVTDAMRKAA